MIGIVCLYSIGMIWFGKSFAIPLFDLLQFGPNTATITTAVAAGVANGGTGGAGGGDLSTAASLLKWTTSAAATSFNNNNNSDDDLSFIEYYCLFMFGVIGSILIGWMVLMYNIIQQFMMIIPSHTKNGIELQQLQLQLLRAMARKSIFYSIVSWFVFDTSFSITIRQYEHAIYNIPFLLLLVVPLIIMEQCDPKITEEVEAEAVGGAATSAAKEATNDTTKKTS